MCTLNLYNPVIQSKYSLLPLELEMVQELITVLDAQRFLVIIRINWNSLTPISNFNSSQNSPSKRTASVLFYF